MDKTLEERDEAGAAHQDGTVVSCVLSCVLSHVMSCCRMSVPSKGEQVNNMSR